MKFKNNLIYFITAFSFSAILSISCQKEQPNPNPYIFLASPFDIIFDESGSFYLTDYWNHNILSVTSVGIVQPLVNINMQQGCGGDNGPCFFAEISLPHGITIDNSGNIYFADFGCGTIHKIDASTHIMTLIAGNGSIGYNGDGDLALNASFTSLEGIVVDKFDNLYIADGSRIRKVVLNTGIISTVVGNGIGSYGGDGGPATAAKINSPYYIATDDTGNLYISDGNNSRIRKMKIATNIISTIAGDGISGYNGDSIPALSAELNSPAGIKVDSIGNLYFCDIPRIREIDAKTNRIYTVAGNGIDGYSGDGGPAISAELSNPLGLALDSQGNLYIIDGVIRKITISSGIITTVLK